MSVIKKKLLADYESNHIVMVHPHMHRDKSHYCDLYTIFSSLNKIFINDKTKQTIVFDENSKFENLYDLTAVKSYKFSNLLFSSKTIVCLVLSFMKILFKLENIVYKSQ